MSMGMRDRWSEGFGSYRQGGQQTAWPRSHIMERPSNFQDMSSFMRGGLMSEGMRDRWTQGVGSYGRALNPRATPFSPGGGRFY